jgi:PBP1b-binding outer membrane lipoprotein LpoB
MKKISKLMLILAIAIFAVSCGSSGKTDEKSGDTTAVVNSSTDTSALEANTTNDTTIQNGSQAKVEQSKIMIYSFHVTNRCASCIAIEESTKKTLDTYFKNEVKSGRIKLSVLNVDDKANEKIAEKYQAFGSGLFVTRMFKGKETTADLTGDGFKYARNKQDKFIEILKGKIQEFLK